MGLGSRLLHPWKPRRHHYRHQLCFSNRSRPSPQACSQANSRALQHGEGCQLCREDSRHAASVNLQQNGIPHRHYGRKSHCRGNGVQSLPLAQKNSTEHADGRYQSVLMRPHENSTKRADLRYQSVNRRPDEISTQHADLRYQAVHLRPSPGGMQFHSQGPVGGHGLACSTGTNSVTRHLDGYQANSHSSCIIRNRNRRESTCQFSVCRTLPCSIHCGATVQLALLWRGVLHSTYCSCFVRSDYVPGLEHLQKEPPSESQLDSLLTDPQFCRYSRNKVSELVSYLNERGLAGYTIVKRCPAVLNYELSSLDKKLKFLEGFGLDPLQMSRFLAWKTDRTVLGLSLVNLQEHVQFLRDIGLCDDDIKWVLIREPRFPFLNVERKLYNILSFYMEVGLNMEAFSQLVRSRPILFTYSPKRLLFEVSRLLQHLDKETMLSTYEARYTLLLSLGFSKDDLYKMCKVQINFSTLKADTMEQKIRYLTKVLKRDVRELINFPLFLSFSLEKRIIPRFQHIDELSKKGLLNKQPSLATVLRGTHKQFERRFPLHCARAKSESS